MAMTRPLACAVLALALLGGPGQAQSGNGPFTVAETGQSFGSLQDAVTVKGPLPDCACPGPPSKARARKAQVRGRVIAMCAP